MGRALPGPDDYEQIPALAERRRTRTMRFFEMLDRHLAGQPIFHRKSTPIGPGAMPSKQS